jgi:hypothetical protein
MRTAVWTVLAALLITNVPTGGAQNLLDNGDFDSDVSGWAALGADLSIVWDPEDHAADPGSGSLYSVNNAPAAGNFAIVSCVDSIPDGLPYQVSGWVKLPSGQPVDGRTELFWYWYDAPSCSGSQTSQPGTSAITVAEDWTFLQSSAEVAPPGTMSAWVVLLNNKNDADPGALQISFDGISFHDASEIFSDGFESGTTSAWTSVVP